MEVENQVLSYAPSSEKPGAWLKLKTLDDKGEPRDQYIKDASLAALVIKPGFYTFTKEKKGQYWDITGVKFLRPLGGAATPASNGQPAAQSSARSPNVADVNVIIQNRAITAQVCVKAAAEVFGKALDNGMFKFVGAPADVSQVDSDTLTSAAAFLARKFMEECKTFVAGEKEAPKASQPKPGQSYQDEAGRTHEPVPEGA